ncbi:MAG: T9SS type A sorting domain-containing protein [bacterium]|nr:T9SS type A sorting domain-containing protein [bacterium]
MGSYATSSYTSVAVLAAGGSVVSQHNDRPICGSYDAFEWAELGGNALPFMAYLYAYGSNCTSAHALIDVANTAIHVPTDFVPPDPDPLKSYAVGHIWNRQSDWLPGTSPLTQAGNPNLDTQGNMIWRYEWATGGAIGAPDVWYEAPTSLMYWDPNWYGAAAWCRGNDLYPGITPTRAVHALTPDAHPYVPIIRWINTSTDGGTYSISGQLLIEWTGPTGIGSPCDVDLVVAHWDMSRGDVTPILAATLTKPNPDDSSGDSVLVPVDVQAELGIADQLVVSARGRSTTTAPRWIVLTDDLDITLLEVPDPARQLAAVRVMNTSDQLWHDVRIRAHDAFGAPVDSIAVAVLEADTELRWLTPALERLGTMTFSAMQGDDALYVTEVAEELLYTPPTLLPTISAADLEHEPKPIIRRCSGMWDRCRFGRIALDLWTDGVPGVSTIDIIGRTRNSSDEFDAPTLGSGWSPEVPCSPLSAVSLTERPGFLRIKATQQEDGADYSTVSNYCAPRVVQSVAGDWTLEARLEFEPEDNFTGAGIMINGQRVAERSMSGSGHTIRCVGGSYPYDGAVSYFRIVKTSDQVVGYWSSDGAAWVESGSRSLDAHCVALAAYRTDWDSNSSADAIADFDYVRFSGLSPVPEAEQATVHGILSQNYPNPFNPLTTIEYRLVDDQVVDLTIFDARGHRVARIVDADSQQAGLHVAEWDGKNEEGHAMPAGLYFYRISAGDRKEVRRMVLLR